MAKTFIYENKVVKYYGGGTSSHAVMRREEGISNFSFSHPPTC